MNHAQHIMQFSLNAQTTLMLFLGLRVGFQNTCDLIGLHTAQQMRHKHLTQVMS